MNSIFKAFRGYALCTDYDGAAWIECMTCNLSVYGWTVYAEERLPEQLETAHHNVVQHTEACHK